MIGVSLPITTVAVIGLGYVGLPLALTCAEAGLVVLGIDHDQTKVDQLAEGASYIRHIGPERVAQAIAAGSLRPTADPALVAEAQAVLITVPTPLTADRQPDLHYVEDTCRAIAPHLRPGTLVVLESTTWPGTTVEVVAPLLTTGSGLCAGHDLFIAYSPEREDPGNRQYSTVSIPKLVGGLSSACTQRAVAFYRQVVDTVVPLTDSRVAEAAKLCENIFRSVNIALVNELKMICDALELDVWEVIRAAATKPFGYMPFWPGPGMGGHCIPIDPFYLSWKAARHGVDSRFIALAGDINRAMPGWVAGKVEACLAAHGKTLAGSRILVLGLAYKPDIDDERESPAYPLIDHLEGAGAQVDHHDPLIDRIPVTRAHPQLAGRRSCLPGSQYDCFVLITAHSTFDQQDLLAHQVPIVDTRHHFPDNPLVWRA